MLSVQVDEGIEILKGGSEELLKGRKMVKKMNEGTERMGGWEEGGEEGGEKGEGGE
jgi:hypothetical protein